jgi:ABC-type polar amino acid transport system ATPase subunit
MSTEQQGTPMRLPETDPQGIGTPASDPGGIAAHGPIIEMKHVGKWYGQSQVLKNIDLTIETGSVVVICGPSGSGKSTVLRCICGLEEAQTGTIEVMRRVLNKETLSDANFRSDIGMVFQRFSLFPHMRVLANLTLAPRKVRNISRAEAEAQARLMLARVGLPDKADAYPNELSGGQQQRVAIARALVMKPKIMLFDEPTSALDPDLVREVLDVMRELAKSGMTMVVVTHEMGFARQAGDRVVFMNHGEILENRPTSEFFAQPATEPARRFLENVLHH